MSSRTSWQAGLVNPLWKRQLVALTVTVLAVDLGGWALLERFLPRSVVIPGKAETTLRQEQAFEREPIDSDSIRRAMLSSENLDRSLAEIGLGSTGRTVERASAVGKQLRVDVRPAERGREVGVELQAVAGLTGSQSVALLTSLVKNFAHSEREHRISEAERAYHSAGEALTGAREDYQRELAIFDAFLDRAFRTSSLAKPVAEPPAANRASPEEVALRVEIATLSDRREILLERRTREHPEVRDLDLQLEDLRKQLASLPIATNSIDQASPAISASERDAASPGQLVISDGRKLQQLRENLDGARAECERRADEERKAWEQLVRCRDADAQTILSATVAPLASKQGSTLPWQFALLVASLAAGAGMAWLVMPAHKTFQNVSEIKEVLFLPIVGILGQNSVS
jgi:hypothetical protein